MASGKALLITSVKDDHYYRHGFAVLVNKCIALAEEHYKEHGNLKVFIDDEQINHIFPRVQKHPDCEYYEVDLTYSDLIGNQAHQEFNSAILKDQHFIFLKIFKENAIFKNNYFGVHCRGTDKKTEVRPLKWEKLKAVIDNAIADKKIIHVATDDNYWLKKIEDNYQNKNGKFTWIDCERSKMGKPIHFNKKERQRLNEEVWTDISYLASCEKFAYCYSNVSYLAAIIGAHNHKELINLQ